jgi:eukaryotic-like serine/threonine-protein kinase
VAKVAPPAPRLVDPALDPDLERIILKAMDKDPARRYATAKDLADALHEWSARASDWFSMLTS